MSQESKLEEVTREYSKASGFEAILVIGVAGGETENVTLVKMTDNGFDSQELDESEIIRLNVALELLSAIL